ncbi:hypothetical protein ACWC2K_20765 [Streptomyces chattanoogensis]|uniref:hypothetical protein n=1 Tax=Streptomyces chattanoogensis TaxID=66876 RepID=UPI0036B70035
MPLRSRTRPRPHRRAAALPLLPLLLPLAGLLLTMLPCCDTAAHEHPRPAGPVSRAPVPLVPVSLVVPAQATERPAAVPEAVETERPHAECGPGPAGRIPQGRASAGDGAGASAVTSRAPETGLPHRPVRTWAARNGPPCGGRCTLALLCRCRI